MSIPHDYTERVYAGVLGKMIGVYLGRPFEGWTYERIQQELGEIQGYVHERLNKPLVVTDDDLSGTFTFLRALPDHGMRGDLSPAQIGETWLNYLIEKRTTLWWGGLGNSTEHTAYLRLKAGIPAPHSGSAAMNGKVVAEQIGAQIFIDGWGMVAPGDPELAASLAQRAASVSHDGEAIYAAQVIATMEALAFIEPDLDRLLDGAVQFIPQDSVIYHLIDNLRQWRAVEKDWHVARSKLAERYGYERYLGNCHVIPNHGLVILSLLYGDGDFQKSLTIVNTCGWDTDCNSGNVGCLLGIKNGLAGIEAGRDWRSPLADRLFVVSADGGGVITDAVREAYNVAATGCSLAGESPFHPKQGARFHFEPPGSVQGFQAEADPGEKAKLRLENTSGHSRSGRRSLAFHYELPAPECAVRAATPTFILPEERAMLGYELLASPTLYPGQIVLASVQAFEGNAHPIACRLFARYYDGHDQLNVERSPKVALAPGEIGALEWVLSLPPGATAYALGLELSSSHPAQGALYLDSLSWSGAPQVAFTRPAGNGVMWRRAWVDAVDSFRPIGPEIFRPVQNQGRGLLVTGTRDWQDYSVSASITPHLAAAAGIAARVQGLHRYYGLLLSKTGVLRLVRVCGEETFLGEVSFPWDYFKTVSLRLQVAGQRIRAWADGHLFFDLDDEDGALEGGGIGLLIEEGCLACESVRVESCQLQGR